MAFSPTNRQHRVELGWDLGTVYDFFVSLSVLHKPERIGLRPSWAAGVRSRLPAAEREFLAKASELMFPYKWAHSLPRPRDTETMLSALAELPEAQRLYVLGASDNLWPELDELFRDVAARGSWTSVDYAQLQRHVSRFGWQGVSPADLRQLLQVNLDLWMDPVGSGEGLLAAYKAYYEQFFAEEELRLMPYLESAQAHLQELSTHLTLTELLEVASQGVRADERVRKGGLILVPSFWITPRVRFAQLDVETDLYLYGARPEGVSLIPGDEVPDALFQALKAMADPTRLRILRYLTDEPQTPAQLARRLRLRPPTVIHHLDALRVARLVHITLSDEGKQYAARVGAVDATYKLLKDFLTR